MELKDYIRVLRRRWLWIAVSIVVFGAVAAGLTVTQAKVYESSARLFVSTSKTESSELLQGSQFSAQRVKSYADLTTSRELASRVIDDLDLDVSPADLSDHVRAAVVQDTVNLTLTVDADDSHRAQSIAQSYAVALVDMVQELETPPGGTRAPVKATIIDSASYSSVPVSPKPVRNLAFGLILGLLVGVGLAGLREVLDTRVTSADDVGEVSSAPVLASIGYDAGTSRTPLVSEIDSHAARVEAFRVLRTNLQFVEVDAKKKIFVISSSVPAEGKTTTSVNLAISLAQAGVKVLLLEGDLRRPQAAKLLQLDGAVGVTTVLVGRVELADAIQTHEPTGLDILASGIVPPNPAELLQSHAMAEMLEQLRSLYDIVIVDAPPLLPVTDAALLATQSDGTMLIVRHGKTTRDQVRHSIERLSQVDARVLGVVLNMTPSRNKGYGYGYGYGYAPDTAHEVSGLAPATKTADAMDG